MDWRCPTIPQAYWEAFWNLQRSQASTHGLCRRQKKLPIFTFKWLWASLQTASGPNWSSVPVRFREWEGVWKVWIWTEPWWIRACCSHYFKKRKNKKEVKYISGPPISVDWGPADFRICRFQTHGGSSTWTFQRQWELCSSHFWKVFWAGEGYSETLEGHFWFFIKKNLCKKTFIKTKNDIERPSESQVGLTENKMAF